ncbi:MAG: zinc-dependent metalloprotease, partial [Planctomycetia bacterium]
FARSRAELVAQVMPLIAERMTAKEKDGTTPGYERVRQAFGVLLSAHGQAMHFAARLVGGLHTSRSHRGDANAPAPFRVVDVKQQRGALELLEKEMFAATPFNFPPALLNQLASTRWRHWGADLADREDYPIHDTILMWQDRVLGRLLDPLTLERIRDGELKVPADQDVLGTGELLDRLTKAILGELETTAPGEYSTRKPAIASLRRGLQRSYAARLARLALGSAGGGAGGLMISIGSGDAFGPTGGGGFSVANPDAQALAAEQLRGIDGRITALLGKAEVKLDGASRAHLSEMQVVIRKVLDARVEMPRP